VGLYNPLSGTGGPFDAVGDAAVELFNDTVAAAATDADIRAMFADVFPLFQDRGSELTHAAETPLDVHPNDSGHYLMARAVIAALGLPAESVATPPSGAPPVASPIPTPSPRPPGALPTVSPTATAGGLPAAGAKDDDDSTPWALYVGSIAAGAIVVAGGLLVLVRRRRR
jgi:hypothetical protein